jgi:hypothetical protein
MFALFKFGQEDHLTALRQQGHMHMKTMRYFAEMELENTARGDRLEGAANIFQRGDFKMTISHPQLGDIEVNPDDLAGPTFFSREREANQNIFCLFSLTEPTATRSVLHREHLHFGSHFVLILNPIAFIERVREQIKRLNLSGSWRPVKYFDESNYTGEVGPFRKSNRFAYQQEYRIVIQPGQVPFRDLKIGDISDITSPVLPLSELDQHVDFSRQTAIDVGLL